jgi:hypothetical protein
VLGVNVALVVGVVCDTVWREFKQTVVRVKHSPWQLDEEVSCETACINTRLPNKIYVESAFQVTRLLVAQLSVRLCEHIFASDLDASRISVHTFSLHLLDLFSEKGSFILKIQYVWHRFNESTHVELSTNIVCLCHEYLIDYLLVEHTKLTKLK